MSNRKLTAAIAAAAMLFGVLSGCQSRMTALDTERPTITVMCAKTDNLPSDRQSPVWQALEEYIGARLDVSWIPQATYDEKMTATLGSGNYPMVMLITSRSPGVIQSTRAGAFWEIGNKIKNKSKYPNLSAANETVLGNISVDGKVYGIYRARPLTKYGITIRRDWLEQLDMDMPQTVDEFYDVLKAFKTNDPDKNARADTYGMAMTASATEFNNLAVWFGAPNGYGIDEQSKELVAAHMTEEYFDAMQLVKKLYDEKLINRDMSDCDEEEVSEQFVKGKAGAVIGTMEQSGKLFEDVGAKNKKAQVGVTGYLKRNAAADIRTLPTGGYDGYFVFPKAALAGDADIDFVLGVMDKMNDEQAQNLMNYGIEGRQYTVVDGFVRSVDDDKLLDELGGMRDINTGITAAALKTPFVNSADEAASGVMKDSEQYALENPAEAFVTQTYMVKGAALDAIISDARIRFITGRIDESQWRDELGRWRTEGGDELLREINEEYKKVK